MKQRTTLELATEYADANPNASIHDAFAAGREQLIHEMTGMKVSFELDFLAHEVGFQATANISMPNRNGVTIGDNTK